MISVETRDDGVRVLTLINPARRNAIDEATLDAFEVAMAQPHGVRCWLVRGQGGHFCAGYDLKALSELTPTDALPDERIGRVFDELAALDAPTVAYVEGAAFGAGLELACACDFRIANPVALFSIPPAKLGIVYAPKGIARVSAVVGQGRAKNLFLTGRRVDATEAKALGLVDDVGDEARALALCSELAQNAPLALAGMKRIFRGESGEHIDALRRESFGSDDAREGVAALLEKRPPKFTGY